MKLTALAVVILALGIVVGFALAGGASGPASAVPKCPGPSSQCPTPTPAPLQQREDQITMFVEPGSAGIGISDVFGTNGEKARIALDPADYPSTSIFRFEAVVTGLDEVCVRLFNRTTGTTVSGSEVCGTGGLVGGDGLRLRSGPFTIANGEHVYVFEGRSLALEPEQEKAHSARIIVEWTE